MALLLIIALVGSVGLYYSPLFQQPQITTTTVMMTQNVQTGGQEQLDAVAIYAQASPSVVTVQGFVTDIYGTGGVLGTGFVVEYDSSYYVITNFHVVDGLTGTTVTFPDGDAYPATVVGSDAYSDLAVVAVDAPSSEFRPLQLGVSYLLNVGEPVVAIGSPYGLSGTITVGVVSQVGRTLLEDTLGGFAIADTIQFSAAINPGNSGGPLIDSEGMVVGITTATTSGSEGLGFAIPSDTISRELPYLVKDGSYDRHPYLGIQLVDMDYQLSQAMQTTTTWGVLIESTTPGGPADKAGLRGGTQDTVIGGEQYIIGGDIIVSFDGNKIPNYDALSSYLERNATPGQTVQVGIVRSGEEIVIPVQVGSRPQLSMLSTFLVEQAIA